MMQLACAEMGANNCALTELLGARCVYAGTLSASGALFVFLRRFRSHLECTMFALKRCISIRGGCNSTVEEWDQHRPRYVSCTNLRWWDRSSLSTHSAQTELFSVSAGTCNHCGWRGGPVRQLFPTPPAIRYKCVIRL